MKPRLIVEQKITAFVNKYAIYNVDEAGNKSTVAAFAQQKRLAFKEKVTFYTDESKTAVAFTMRAEKVLDVHGRYIIEDVNGQYIGAFRKQFKKSLLNSSWSILGQGDTVALSIRESSQFLALLRRFGGFIPVVGDIIDLVVLFFKYHFVFTDANQQEVGRYQKTTLFRDHYLLSMNDASFEQTDPRVLAAFSVALDALQSR